MEQSDLRKLQVEKTPGTRKGNLFIDCIWANSKKRKTSELVG